MSSHPSLNKYTIRRAEDRYPEMEKRGYPLEFSVTGMNFNQTENLAELLSNYYSGCDYLYYVVEDDS